jgi:hypothetical protein
MDAFVSRSLFVALTAKAETFARQGFAWHRSRP